MLKKDFSMSSNMNNNVTPESSPQNKNIAANPKNTPNEAKPGQALSLDQIEKTVNKTDFGHFLYEHRKTALIIGIVILVANIGYSVFKNQKEAKLNEELAQVASFNQNYFSLFFQAPEAANPNDPKDDKAINEKNAEKKKITFEEMINGYASLSETVKGSPSFFPFALKMVSEYEKQNKASDALSILAPFTKSFNKNTESYYFLAYKLATLNDNLGNKEEAIKYFEELAKSSQKFFESHVYLNLGRIYKEQGNKDLAKKNLDYIIKNFPNEENAKIAQVLLNQI